MLYTLRWVRVATQRAPLQRLVLQLLTVMSPWVDHPSSVGCVHAQRGGDGVNVGGGSLEVVVCASGMIVPAS